MRTIGLAGVFLFLFFLSPVLLQAQVNGVSAEFKLDQDQYLPGEDIQLKITVLNRSGQELFLGKDENWLTLSIVNEKGIACERTGHMPVAGEFSLQSGEMGTKKLNPAPYFTITKLGRYRVTGTIRLAQWDKEVECRPIYFTIGNGAPLLNLANLQFGVPLPPGVSNRPPDIRKYTLLKVQFLKEIKLYCRVTDDGGRIIRVQPISKMMSFSEPEAQIDRFSNFHVLLQTGARDFSYCVINPDGQFISRETYLINETRPVLHLLEQGKIGVVGGQRVASTDDILPVAPDYTPLAARKNP